MHFLNPVGHMSQWISSAEKILSQTHSSFRIIQAEQPFPGHVMKLRKAFIDHVCTLLPCTPGHG